MNNSLTPWQRYQEAMSSGQYEQDPAQAQAMQDLEQLYFALEQPVSKLRLKKLFSKAKKYPWQGVYLYGAVGAGKTWMMDMFYQSLTCPKLRMHFHHFMREVHDDLRSFQGKKEPLKLIAKQLAAKAKVVCLDELFVNDIADAMVLGELFHYMFEFGVCWVMTSNCTPDMLYRNGLQRAQFLPAIELLKAKMQMVEVKSLKDYRWRDALSQGVYFSPIDASSQQQLQTFFEHVTAGELLLYDQVEVNQRKFNCVCFTQDILWCQFKQLCSSPRSVQDYVSLTKKFHLFILDEVPVLNDQDENGVWYFISLIDVLYDAHCRLVLRSEVLVQELYRGQKFSFEFQRTLSRLVEMQTQEYWL